MNRAKFRELRYFQFLENIEIYRQEFAYMPNNHYLRISIHNLKKFSLTMLSKRLTTILLTALLALTASITRVMADTGSDATDLRNRGTAFLQAGRYIDALDCYMEGMRIASDNGETDIYCSCLGNIATVYGIIGNHDRSLECQLEVYRIASETKDSLLTSQILVNLFGTYIQKGETDNARRIFDLQTKHPSPDISLTRHYFLYNQALLAKANGDKEMAAFYFSKTADHAKAHNDTVRLISQLIELGNLFTDSNDLDKAGEYADSALCLSALSRLRIKRIDALGLKERVLRAAGDSSEAERYHLLRVRQEDSIFGQQQINMINNRLFEYEKQTSGRKIDGLERKVRVQWQTIAFGTLILIILLAACILVVINYRRTKAAQKLLIARNAELEQADQQNQLLLASIFDAKETERDDSTEDSRHSDESKADSILSDEQANRILNDVLKIMEDIAAISNPEFSLSSLARSVGSNTKYVALAIKQKRGKTFKEFLNEYRIREACRRLSDQGGYGHVTIETIYKDLGYGSASGFIDAFKKINGMTPSRYQRLSRETHKNLDGEN